MKRSLAFAVTETRLCMQQTPEGVRGKTENEAVGRQSLIGHCAVT